MFSQKQLYQCSEIVLNFLLLRPKIKLDTGYHSLFLICIEAPWGHMVEKNIDVENCVNGLLPSKQISKL